MIEDKVVCSYSDPEFLEKYCLNFGCPHHLRSFTEDVIKDNPIVFTEMTECGMFCGWVVEKNES